MSEARVYVMSHAEARQRALNAVAESPDGYRVKIEPPKRSLDQNAKFHALCSDLARQCVEWAGMPRTAEEWKVLLVSGHAAATGLGAELVRGLEGEFVMLRESTAAMSRARGSSLIEYAMAWCAQNNVKLSGGFND
jgi:hypothetical protein